MENVEVILTPMTNAPGYYHNEREERLPSSVAAKVGKKSLDINRDFPYNQETRGNCLNTKASRIVYSIFTKNSIQASLTFHGGDNVIGYPWGSFNWSKKSSYSHYKGYMPPDYHSFSKVARVLKKKSGQVDFGHSQSYNA